MKVTILGTGVVGQTIASRLVELHHQVVMGTRNPHETIQRTEPNQMTGTSFSEWHKINSAVTLMAFNEAANEADLVINATNGSVSLAVLKTVGKETLKGKVLLDVANPLDFSKGMPPSLAVCNTDSLAEQIQREFPETLVVKSLNTMNTVIMMHPVTIAGDHNVFVCGNDENARQMVKHLLYSIGWKHENILDLGDITAARGMEMLLPIWLRLYGTFGHANFNFHIQADK
ncbi:NADPH-dependent F420 reductase [Saccharicrinis sp. FJH2]|uniref:NADPH-dependent F420 reductase n=1 Tax=Saccharicrinis sp. FJH65 TaxID=3344659 RepID=UPI0035F2FEA1